MPTYTFYIYSVDVLSYNSGTRAFDFDAGYDYRADRYRVEVTDDDDTMDARGDATQTAIIYNMDNKVVDSGTVYVPAYAELDNGFYLDRVEVNGTHYGYVSSDPLTPGKSYGFNFSNTDEMSHKYYQTNSVPCFGPDTLIDTPNGPKPIANICVGDEVWTLDRGVQPVIWAGQRSVSRMQALANRRLRPTSYAGDLEGTGQPTHPLTLSQNHRLLIADPMAEYITGQAEVFVKAGWVSRSLMPKASISWHHILLPQHEVIRANGIWVESLFAGGALDAIATQGQINAIEAALDGRGHLRTARPCVRRYEAQVLLSHLRKTKPFDLSKKRVA